jgi:UDPglucose 6-dehydrogenase
MKIAVIGTGYVGLVTGTCFADNGNDVWCVDIDARKIERLNKGEVPIYEPGLDQMIARNVTGERLRFTTDLQEAVRQARIVFLCVGTPSLPDGAPDMRYVYQAAEDVARAMEEHTILVMKSTVPVGTAAEVRRRVAAVTKLPFDVVSNPEFLKEGAAVDDFLKPDRVVIGTDDPRVALLMKELYDPFVRTGNPILVMDNTSAELTKYGANALLAARISFMNELANLADRVGADINQVRQGMGSDSRIGHSFLFPGIGFGGSCLVGRETVLVRQDGRVRLTRFDRLFSALAPDATDETQLVEPAGLEVLSWNQGTGAAEWRPVAAVTRRPFEGETVDVRTKMGRRVRCTPDHPFVVTDADRTELRVKLAGELTEQDWLPLAQRREGGDGAGRLDILGALAGLGIPAADVIVRPAPSVAATLTAQRLRPVIERLGRHPHPVARAHDIVRAGALRLDEARALGISLEGAMLGTAKNGTYVPSGIDADEKFWRVVGLYISEGHISVDGHRHRMYWSFHPTDEAALVQEVVDFWASHGVRADVYRGTTSMRVVISSRILATWWLSSLGMSADCYGHSIPDLAWDLPDAQRRALASGIWHGDGSWSRVNRGPSVVLEHGTASPVLADGMLRLLGDLGVVARQRVARTSKSTVDTHWLTVSGADQVERMLDLVKPEDQGEVRASIDRQQKRIAPTGYRRFADDEAAYVRVAQLRRRPYQGWVYSLEVPGNETFVTTAGLVVHNCFPKDVDALGFTGKQVGLDLKILAATNEVNRAQKSVLFEKIHARFDGDLKGKRIAIWGLAFKPRTDDMREAPSLTVIGHLLEAGATIHAYDPAAEGTTRAVLGEKIEYAKKQYEPLKGADALAICTEWNEFRRPDWDRMKASMRQHVIFDGRNIFEPARVEELGFEYYGIGRGRTLKASKRG